MWEAMWNMGKMMVEIFIPGVGKSYIPAEEVPEHVANGSGVMAGSIMSGYKSVKQIKKECAGAKKEPKPVFILSKSIVFRKRVARILYGTDEEDYFL